MKDFLKKLSQALSSIGLIFVVAFLGALGGQGTKQVRRFLLPLTVTIYTFIMLHNWWVLTIFLMAFPLSLGYGIPSYFGEGNPYNDEGSLIGRFFWNLFKKNNLLANVFTRGFVALLISLTMLSVPIITGKWLSFIAGSIIIITIWATVAWRDSGSIPVKIFGKDYTLLNVDLIVYGVTAIGFVLIINGWLG